MTGWRGQLAALTGAWRPLARADAPTLRRLVLWWFGAALILAPITWAAVTQEVAARRALLAFVLPEGWLGAGELLADRFLATQSRAVLIDAAVGASLLLLSLLLFPLKEAISVAFEADAQLDDGPAEELPLWRQGLEELELALLYLALGLGVFWLGYDPAPWRRAVAAVLGHVLLAATWGIDFLAPPLQRRRGRYADIVVLLLRRPLLTLGLGLIWSAPAAIAGHLLVAAGATDAGAVIVTIFGVNVVMIGLAILTGTAAGVRLRPDLAATRPMHGAVRGALVLALVATVALSGAVFARVAQAAWGASAVLKCTYELDWGSARASLDTDGDPRVSLGLDLIVTNPTLRDLEVRSSGVEVELDGEPVLSAPLPHLRVQAGERARLQLDGAIRLSDLMEGGVGAAAKAWDLGWSGTLDAAAALADAGRWDVRLVVETDVAAFPLYLVTSRR